MYVGEWWYRLEMWYSILHYGANHCCHVCHTAFGTVVCLVDKNAIKTIVNVTQELPFAPCRQCLSSDVLPSTVDGLVLAGELQFGPGRAHSSGYHWTSRLLVQHHCLNYVTILSQQHLKPIIWYFTDFLHIWAVLHPFQSLVNLVFKASVPKSVLNPNLKPHT